MAEDTQKKYVAEDVDSPGHTPIYVKIGDVKTELDQRLDLRRYTEEGFSWGEDSHESKQLALAILADYLDEETAIKYHHAFAKRAVVPYTKVGPFYIEGYQIEEIITELETTAQKRDASISGVEIIGQVDDDESSEISTWYENVSFLAVYENKLHIWYDGKHYIGAGAASNVSTGDVFYYPRGYSEEGPPHIVEVVDMKERNSEEYAVFDDGEEMHLGFIIGSPMQMAQEAPPTKLIEEQW